MALHAAAQTVTPGVCGSDDGVAPLPIEATPEAKAFRESSAGLELGDFTTRDGRTFRDVVVRSADDIRLIFRHRDGTAKLDYPNLPADLQLRFVGHELAPPSAGLKMPDDVLRRFRILRQEALIRRQELDKHSVEKAIEEDLRWRDEWMKQAGAIRDGLRGKVAKLDAHLEKLNERRKQLAVQPDQEAGDGVADLDRQIWNAEREREQISRQLEDLPRFINEEADRRRNWEERHQRFERQLADFETKLNSLRAELARMEKASKELGDDPEAYETFRKEHPTSPDPANFIIR